MTSYNYRAWYKGFYSLPCVVRTVVAEACFQIDSRSTQPLATQGKEVTGGDVSGKEVGWGGISEKLTLASSFWATKNNGV